MVYAMHVVAIIKKRFNNILTNTIYALLLIFYLGDTVT